MGYKLIVSAEANNQLDNIIFYIVNKLKNSKAASEILDEIFDLYETIEKFPESFPMCDDPYLAKKEYRKCILAHYDYVILYLICDDCIKISGIFHARENYIKKL